MSPIRSRAIHDVWSFATFPYIDALGMRSVCRVRLSRVSGMPMLDAGKARASDGSMAVGRLRRNPDEADGTSRRMPNALAAGLADEKKFRSGRNRRNFQEPAAETQGRFGEPRTGRAMPFDGERNALPRFRSSKTGREPLDDVPIRVSCTILPLRRPPASDSIPCRKRRIPPRISWT